MVLLCIQRIELQHPLFIEQINTYPVNFLAKQATAIIVKRKAKLKPESRKTIIRILFGTATYQR